jgi:hypothetical protein
MASLRNLAIALPGLRGDRDVAAGLRRNTAAPADPCPPGSQHEPTFWRVAEARVGWCSTSVLWRRGTS